VEPLLAVVRAGRATQIKHEEALVLTKAKTTVVDPSKVAPASFVREDDSRFVFLFLPCSIPAVCYLCCGTSVGCGCGVCVGGDYDCKWSAAAITAAAPVRYGSGALSHYVPSAPALIDVMWCTAHKAVRVAVLLYMLKGTHVMTAV
jgi:hypothetical protein